MSTVAIIGTDGAGKSTIAHMLEESFPVPIKYLYMGANIESSNYSLPTSRLILYLKLRSYKRAAERANISDPNFVSTHHEAHREIKYGKTGGTLRAMNRLAEAWYRQFISWVYQLRGFIIVYDRHFLFDALPSTKLPDRIYLWILTHLYPRPDLVIFLDAPPEVLLARKGEATLGYLQQRREAYLARGQEMRGFVRVDAAQPLDEVYELVGQHIMRLHKTKKTQFGFSRN